MEPLLCGTSARCVALCFWNVCLSLLEAAASFGPFNVKPSHWQNEMQGTFLAVLFVSCGFIEGAHLLR